MSEDQTAGQAAVKITGDGSVIFGNYLIHELIGVGGMAEVFFASVRGAQGRDKPVVIKRVKPKHAQDPSFVRMFVDEAKLSAKLQHPNIVSVFEFGEVDGHHYIAMEHIDGLHLQGLHVRHAQKYRRQLPWQAGTLIVRDLLLGLDYAHSKMDEAGKPLGLIHRDINLVNVMLSRDGMVKVLDFGIVKAADGIRSAETVGAVLKGKFGYMSPEQAEGRTLDKRSDVFSASIVLHELLTGRRLFWGPDDLSVLRRVRSEEIPDPRGHTPELPETLVQVALKGLCRDLDGRFQSAGDMAAALDRVITEHDIQPVRLQELMSDLLEAEHGAESKEMRRRRRKMTLLAWSHGVREREQIKPRAVSGVLGDADVQDTAQARKPLEAEVPIATYPRFFLPEEASDQQVIIGEQDTLIISGEGLGPGMLDEATLILADADDEVGLKISDAETALFDSPVVSSGSAPETVLLPDDESGAALDEVIASDGEEGSLAGEAVPQPGPPQGQATPWRPKTSIPARDGHQGRRLLLIAVLAGVGLLMGLTLFCLISRP